MRTLLKALCKTFPVLLVWLFASLAVFAHAQQAAAPTSSQDDPNQQLLKRVQELEKEVRALKAQPSAAPAPEPAPEPPAVN